MLCWSRARVEGEASSVHRSQLALDIMAVPENAPYEDECRTTPQKMGEEMQSGRPANVTQARAVGGDQTRSPPSSRLVEDVNAEGKGSRALRASEMHCPVSSCIPQHPGAVSVSDRLGAVPPQLGDACRHDPEAAASPIAIPHNVASDATTHIPQRVLFVSSTFSAMSTTTDAL